MTTQTTTIQSSTKGMHALIGAAAASLALLGGALLWQARPVSETATPVAATSMSTSTEGAAPMGGLAEQERDEHEAAAAAAAARLTTRGGMAEFYAERRPVATAAPVTTTGGMAEFYGEQQAAARTTAAQLERMGGMAELYREQATAASAR